MLYLHHTLEFPPPQVCAQQNSYRWHEHLAVFLKYHSSLQRHHQVECQAHYTEFLKMIKFFYKDTQFVFSCLNLVLFFSLFGYILLSL